MAQKQNPCSNFFLTIFKIYLISYLIYPGMSKSSEQNVHLLSSCKKKDNINSKMSSRPIVRFGQTSLSRRIATSAPAFAPKKGACSLEVVVFCLEVVY